MSSLQSPEAPSAPPPYRFPPQKIKTYGVLSAIPHSQVETHDNIISHKQARTRNKARHVRKIAALTTPSATAWKLSGISEAEADVEGRENECETISPFTKMGAPSYAAVAAGTGVKGAVDESEDVNDGKSRDGRDGAACVDMPVTGIATLTRPRTPQSLHYDDVQICSEDTDENEEAEGKGRQRKRGRGRQRQRHRNAHNEAPVFVAPSWSTPFSSRTNTHCNGHYPEPQLLHEDVTSSDDPFGEPTPSPTRHTHIDPFGVTESPSTISLPFNSTTAVTVNNMEATESGRRLTITLPPLPARLESEYDDGAGRKKNSAYTPRRRPYFLDERQNIGMGMEHDTTSLLLTHVPSSISPRTAVTREVSGSVGVKAYGSFSQNPDTAGGDYGSISSSSRGSWWSEGVGDVLVVPMEERGWVIDLENGCSICNESRDALLQPYSSSRGTWVGDSVGSVGDEHNGDDELQLELVRRDVWGDGAEVSLVTISLAVGTVAVLALVFVLSLELGWGLVGKKQPFSFIWE